MSAPLDPQELIKEKTLFQVWSLYRKNFPEKGFNRWLYGGASALVALHCIFSKQSTQELAEQVRKLSELGINVSIAMLGFLLAGFTIFATTSRTGLFERMASVQYKESKLSHLKQNFFAFVDIFSVYLIFCSLCLFMVIVTARNGAISAGIQLIGQDYGDARNWVAKIGLWLIGTAFAYVLVRLKIFVFNVFHFSMTGIAWDLAESQRKRQLAGRVEEADDMTDSVRAQLGLMPMKPLSSEGDGLSQDQH